MNIEINNKAIPTEEVFGAGGGTIMFTPPISEDYWLMRVQLTPNQAVVIFPKFGVVGCGFQVEEKDWNTNLPLACPPNVIAKHIWKNHKDATFEATVKAIELLQQKCLEMKLIKEGDLERLGR